MKKSYQQDKGRTPLTLRQSIRKTLEKKFPKVFIIVIFFYKKYSLMVYNRELKNFKGEILAYFKCKNLEFRIFLNRKNGFVDENIYLHGFYEKAILDLIKENSNKNHTFLDIGANIGQHSLFASHYFKKVIAFEPIPKLYDQFNKSIEINNIKNITTYSLGVSNKKETKTIYESFDNIGSSSIIKKKKFDKKEEINLVKLDDFLKKEKVDFIKMDIEGYEYFAFLGMQNILKKHKPKIIFEFSPLAYDELNKKMKYDLLLFLKKLNYSLIDINSNDAIDNLKLFADKIKDHTNIFCKPKEEKEK